jgi:hypothetical protein
MVAPLWVSDLGYAIEFGLWPNCLVNKGGADKAS